MEKIKGKITEIFESIQGEGIYIGTSQVFIRFTNCNLRCNYCDTKYAYNNGKIFTVEEVIKKINLISKNTNWIAITGGEPLLQIDFLSKLLQELRKKKFNIYLETNSTLMKNILIIEKYIDVLCLNYKLDSENDEIRKTSLKNTYFNNGFKSKPVSTTGPEIDLSYIIKNLFKKNKKIFIKIIMTENTKINELKDVVKIAAALKIPIVFQPVRKNKIISKKVINKCIKFQKIFSYLLKDIRIIPGIQNLLNIK